VGRGEGDYRWMIEGRGPRESEVRLSRPGCRAVLGRWRGSKKVGSAGAAGQQTPHQDGSLTNGRPRPKRIMSYKADGNVLIRAQSDERRRFFKRHHSVSVLFALGRPMARSRYTPCITRNSENDEQQPRNQLCQGQGLLNQTSILSKTRAKMASQAKKR